MRGETWSETGHSAPASKYLKYISLTKQIHVSINFGTIASRWIPQIRLNTVMTVKGYKRNYTVSYDYFDANFNKTE